MLGTVALLAACADSPTAPDQVRPMMAAVQRVDVCHLDDQGNYKRITIADAAYDNHIAHGDKAAVGPLVLPATTTFSASAAYSSTFSAARAFDGSLTTSWNAGGDPGQWIEVNFGSPQPLLGMEAVVDQSPAGNTNHDISLDGAYSFSWTGYTQGGAVLGHVWDTPQLVQKVRITTTAGPSWVAWFEIRFTVSNC
jgi:hypothetical protein